MSKNFETIFIQMRRPRDGDCGVTEEGHYRVESNNVVVLVDANGNQRKDTKGRPIKHKLTPADNPRSVAARLVRANIPDRRGDFNRKLNYFNMGKF
jgi:hypothetical protein